MPGGFLYTLLLVLAWYILVMGDIGFPGGHAARERP